MGLQVSRGIRAQAAAQSNPRADASGNWGRFSTPWPQKECQIVEGRLMSDHVHMCIAIPPKHPVASVIGALKGKSAANQGYSRRMRERHWQENVPCQ